MDRLSETHLRYLLTIYHLGQTVPDVSVIQIAQTLNVSKPSVTNMLNNLMDKAQHGISAGGGTSDAYI